MRQLLFIGVAITLAACGSKDAPTDAVESQIKLQASIEDPANPYITQEADCPAPNPDIKSSDDMVKKIECGADKTSEIPITLEADCPVPNPAIKSADDMAVDIKCDANKGSSAAMILTPELSDRFARLALDCVQREYPNKISHTMNGDADAKTPRELHPAFYGCFDWHSSVHGHWLLVRLLNVGSQDAPWRDEAVAKLQANLTPENMAAERTYLMTEGRGSFERPYGLAWLLQLGAELRQWDDPRAADMLDALTPLEDAVIAKTQSWLPNLAYPIRLGTHNQSAFGFALMYDYAGVAGHDEFAAQIKAKSLEFHKGDVNCPINYEPSGEDFLSPCLQTADLMRRFMSADAYSKWLAAFLPNIPRDGAGDWLAPGVVKDATDGKLVHLDGVNLSRAWNLDGMIAGLPKGDPRIASLKASRDLHLSTGTAAVSDAHYSGSHWLASFAVYAVTKRGVE
ncbi:DUF2891 domain-containing protein [Robiginitomaculum antarcticum]|uniref:DUF2891 domain-containing protein n=1 Tax=Robiginitomaculum antarcticum TaxID=437507 RepID=UPI0003734CAC|nr:DUF2891 domain-containing protein [Robiginitomaculum antarcticum]